MSKKVLCRGPMQVTRYSDGWGFACGYHGSYRGRYASKGAARRAANGHQRTTGRR